MTIHQGFGDRLPAPTGISGDFSIGHESGSDASRQALLAQQAYFNELLDRQAAGRTTPDEDALIQRHFDADLAHGNN